MPLILTQIFCFYIICLYLNIKINSLNERLIDMKEKKLFKKIVGILHSFDSLYIEINEFNTTFWSKFLFAFWLTFGSMTVECVYVCCFALLPILIKVMVFYVSVLLFLCFLFVIFTASSVNYTANKTHKILNSFLISYSQNARNHYITQFVLKIKVSLNWSKFKLTQFFIHKF